jgi:hypothetical protein
MQGIIYMRKGVQTTHSTTYHEDAQNRGDAPVVGDPGQAETKGAPSKTRNIIRSRIRINRCQKMADYCHTTSGRKIGCALLAINHVIIRTTR